MTRYVFLLRVPPYLLWIWNITFVQIHVFCRCGCIFCCARGRNGRSIIFRCLLVCEYIMDETYFIPKKMNALVKAYTKATMKTLTKLTHSPYQRSPFFLIVGRLYYKSYFYVPLFFIEMLIHLKGQPLPQNPSSPKKWICQPSSPLLPMIIPHGGNIYLFWVSKKWLWFQYFDNFSSHLGSSYPWGKDGEHSRRTHKLECVSGIWETAKKYQYLKFLKLSIKKSNIFFAWWNERKTCPCFALVEVCFMLNK